MNFQFPEKKWSATMVKRETAVNRKLCQRSEKKNALLALVQNSTVPSIPEQ